MFNGSLVSRQDACTMMASFSRVYLLNQVPAVVMAHPPTQPIARSEAMSATTAFSHVYICSTNSKAWSRCFARSFRLTIIAQAMQKSGVAWKSHNPQSLARVWPTAVCSASSSRRQMSAQLVMPCAALSTARSESRSATSRSRRCLRGCLPILRQQPSCVVTESAGPSLDLASLMSVALPDHLSLRVRRAHCCTSHR